MFSDKDLKATVTKKIALCNKQLNLPSATASRISGTGRRAEDRSRSDTSTALRHHSLASNA